MEPEIQDPAQHGATKMIRTLFKITDWAEIAGIIIPLLVVLIYKPKGRENRPLVIYIFVAFILNLIITAIAKYRKDFDFIPDSNHVYYNMHSLIKIVFWGWYLSAFDSLKSSTIIKTLTGVFIVFFFINFSFFEPLGFFSTRIASAEGIFLLLFCAIFFISTIIDNSDTIWMSKPVFTVCAAINMYAAINFFVFLFFDYINVEKFRFDTFFSILAIIFSCSYFFLCIVFARALKKNVSLTIK
jgi:hypothetical protein